MTGRGAGLWTAGAVTLLLAAWTSASSPAGIFSRTVGRRPETSAPGVDFGSPEVADPKASKGSAIPDSSGSGFLSDLAGFLVKAVLVLILVAVLVAVARAVRDYWADRDAGTSDEVTADVLPQALLDGARAGEELLARGTPSNAVIAAWVALDDTVRSAGVSRNDALTSTELVVRVLTSYRVDREPLETLAALYREARFSRHPIGEQARSSAREALVRVQADLRSVTQPTGPRA